MRTVTKTCLFSTTILMPPSNNHEKRGKIHLNIIVKNYETATQKAILDFYSNE